MRLAQFTKTHKQLHKCHGRVGDSGSMFRPPKSGYPPLDPDRGDVDEAELASGSVIVECGVETWCKQRSHEVAAVVQAVGLAGGGVSELWVCIPGSSGVEKKNSHSVHSCLDPDSTVDNRCGAVANDGARGAGTQPMSMTARQKHAPGCSHVSSNPRRCRHIRWCPRYP